MKYVIYVGGESTMKKIASKGCIRVLNRKTMRHQDFAKDAEYIAKKDPDSETGWMVLCNRDVRAEAKEQGFII